MNREVRAEIKQSRKLAFHKLVHALGHLLVDNVEQFRHLNAHDAIKKLQQESGVCCEPMETDLGTLGQVEVRVPRSIAFDEMDESEFGEFFKGICDYIDQHHQSAMTDDVRTEYFLMADGR